MSADRRTTVVVWAEVISGGPVEVQFLLDDPERIGPVLTALTLGEGHSNAKLVTGIGDRADEYTTTYPGSNGIMIMVGKANVVLVIDADPSPGSTAIEHLATTAVARAAGGSSANASVPTKFKIDQAMKASDGRTVTITAFQRNFAGALPGPSHPGDECVQVTFALSNGSNSAWDLPTTEVWVVDSGGVKYDTAYNCGQPDKVSSLAAGGQSTANEQYEVPSGFALSATWQPFSLDTSVVFQTPLQ